MTRKGHWLGSHSLIQGHSSRDLETSHCGQVSGLTSQSVLPPSSVQAEERAFATWILAEAYALNSGTRQWSKQGSRFALLIPHSKLLPDPVLVMVIVGSRGKGRGWSLETVVWQKGRLLKTKAISSPYSILVEHTQAENSSQLWPRIGRFEWEQAKVCPHGPDHYLQDVWQCSLMVFFTISLTL